MKAIQQRTAIPGPNSIRLKQERDQEVPKAAFETTPIFIAEAEGALVTDVDGNTFIDFAGGIGSLNSGHVNPEVANALERQMRKYLHTCFHVTMHKPYVDLARRLNHLTPGTGKKKTMLFNSGAEAVENAVKIARYYTGRPAIVCFEHAFHGRTLLTMSLTSKVMPYKLGFGPFAPEIYRLPYPYAYRRPEGMSEDEYIELCIQQLGVFFKTQVDPSQIAAVIMELQTGEGGFIPAPMGYVHALREICREHKILFIADEVQTGFGRTGRMFASEHYEIVPDLITMAKSLGGGCPLSAVTGKAEIMDSVHVGGLGGTFGGNPLSCVAALASIRYMEEHHLIDRAREIGHEVRTRLMRLKMKSSHIGDVRGLGAMVGIELVEDRRTKEPATAMTKSIVQGCYENGLIVLSCGVHGNVIRTLMPLTIAMPQLNEGLDVLEAVILHHEKETSANHHPGGGGNHRTGHRLGLAQGKA